MTLSLSSRWWVLPVIIILAVATRVIGLDKSFQGDEYLSITDARTLTAIPDALLSDTHPPLYFYLLHFWMKLGKSEAWLRLLSVIAGIGLVGAVYAIARETAGAACARASAIIVACAPAAVWASCYVRTYALAAFFTVASVFFLIRILKSGRGAAGDWAGFVFMSAASIYTFYFSVLVVIAENLFVIIMMRRDKDFVRRWFASQLCIAALYMPWIPYFIYQQSSYVGHPQMCDKVGFYLGNIHMGALVRSALGLVGCDPRFMAKGMMSSCAGLKIVAIGVLGSMFLAGSFFLIRFFKFSALDEKQQKCIALFFSIAIVPFAAAIVLHQAAGIILMSHYFLASFVFLIIAATVICGKNLHHNICRGVCALVILIYAVRLGGLYLDKESDFKSAHRYVKSSVADEGFVVAPSFGGAFDYYFSDIPRRATFGDPKLLRLAGQKVYFLTQPGKLELKKYNELYAYFFEKKGYKCTGREAFGDLVVSLYGIQA